MKNRYGLLLAMLLFAACFSSQAQAKEDVDPAKIPSLLGSTNAGTDFWFSFPVCFPEQGGNNSLKIYVSAGAAVQCTVEVPGLGVYHVKTTKPNDIIDFTLYPGEGQPYESMGVPGTAKTEMETYADGKGKGIHVTAPVPIIVYGVSRYVYTSDSFLAIPVSAFGKEYIVAPYADMSSTMFQGYHLPSQAVVVAAYDNTIVTFKLGGSFGTQTVGGMKIGESKQFKMMKGDIVAFANKKINGYKPDISGSKITSTKPIGVVSGNQCANIAVDNQWCDFNMEMELPTHTWGKEYHVTRFISRKNYAYIKVFAKNPNTKLYRDGNPTPFAVLSTSGGKQNAGYYEGRVMIDGSNPKPVIIKGDGPISVTQYNPGQQEDNIPSDPFQLVLTPVEQFQKEITFCTPGIKGGQGFKQNYVNIVFEGNPDGTMPDDLEFATVENSKFEWKPVKSIFGATSEPFKQFPGDTKKYYAKIVSLPGDGVYKIRAEKPFAAYAYGFDSYDSYGHPTSVAVGDLSVRDPETPEFSFTQQCDGSVNDGQVEDLPKVENDTIKRSNLAQVSLLDGSKNYLLEVAEFIPGDDRRTTWKLRVEDATQDALAHVYFADRAGNDTMVTITYAAPAVKFDATSLSYGLLKVGENKTMQLVVRNSSATMPQAITDLIIKGAPANGFTFVTPPTIPDIIEPSGSRTYDIAFTSAVEGDNFKDSVIIEINDCTKIGAELLAKVGEPIIDVTEADFGVVSVGAPTVIKQIRVKNIGKVPLTITGFTGPVLTEFKTAANWPSLPWTLQPQQEQQLDVEFYPLSENTFTDNIYFISDTRKTGVDSVAELTAKTIEGNLLAEGYPWGRKRINKNYGDGFVKISNNGTAEITIISAQKETATGTHPEAFTIAPMGQTVVKPGETIQVPATFNPIETGEHKAIYRIVTSDKDLFPELTGFGITGVIAITPTVNFGNTLVNSPTPQTKTVTLSIADDGFPQSQSINDSVTISDLIVGAVPNAISTTMTGFGTEGFRYNKALVGMPVTLQPGQSIEIDADFVAQRAGGATATLTTQSDADNGPQTSTWIGAGLTEGITPSFTSTPVCINADGMVELTIRNDNNTDAVINNITVANQTPGVTVFTPLDPVNFTVLANNVKPETVRFRAVSSVVGTNTVTLMIESSTSSEPQEFVVTFETVDYTRTASMSRALTVDVGNQIVAGITLEAGEAFALAEVHKLNIAFNYDPTLVQVDGASFKTTIPGFAITGLNIDRTLGSVAFSLESTPTASLPRSGPVELVTWKFDAFLNNRPIDNMEITQTVTVPDNACLKIESKAGFLTVNPVCGGDVRRINVSGITYALQSVKPNPVTGNHAEIEFQVGLKSHTVIEIYNAMGVTVGRLVNQVLEPGTYAVPVNTTTLSSGSYFYRIISGPYSDTKELIIAK